MKLEEAAAILGLSLEDITIDGLKQTYRKLAMALDPEKCKDPISRQRYQQISEAYKKLNSVMEGTDGAKMDSAHEIDAFMRMFMDMVGISEHDTIPAGAEFSISHPAMTFGMGMMFGSRQNSMDEWSTDDEGDGEYEDEDDEDDEDGEEGEEEGDEDEDDDEEEDGEDEENEGGNYTRDEYNEEYRTSIGYNGGPNRSNGPMGPNGSIGSNGHYLNHRHHSPMFPMPPPPPHFDDHLHHSGSSNGKGGGNSIGNGRKKPPSGVGLAAVAAAAAAASEWEPAAKQYSNMNLKAQISQERNGTAGKKSAAKKRNVNEIDDFDDFDNTLVYDDQMTEAEKEKKLKAAKKRAEKKKKQKERKQREAMSKAEAEAAEAEASAADEEEEEENDKAFIVSSRATIPASKSNDVAASSSHSNNSSKSITATVKEHEISTSTVAEISPMQQLSRSAETSDVDDDEYSRLLQAARDFVIEEVRTAIANGQLGKVNQILSYDFSEELPSSVASDLIALLKQQLPISPLLHQCVTDFHQHNSSAAASVASVAATAAAVEGNKGSSPARKKKQPTAGSNQSGDATTGNSSSSGATNSEAAMAARRLEVAKYLLNFRTPSFDLSVLECGLSVLHHAVACGDAQVAQVVIRAFTEGSAERKTQLNLNSRCHRKGWAPVHYAVEAGSLDCLKLLAQCGANLSATMATDKRYTPLELARLKLKSAPAAAKTHAQAVVEELQLGIERQKASKKAEGSQAFGANSSSSSGVVSGEVHSAVSSSKSKTQKVSDAKSSSASNSSATTASSSSKATDKKKKKQTQAQPQQQQQQQQQSNLDVQSRPPLQSDTKKKNSPTVDKSSSSAESKGQKSTTTAASTPEKATKASESAKGKGKDVKSESEKSKTRIKDEQSAASTVATSSSKTSPSKEASAVEDASPAPKLSKRQAKKLAAANAAKAVASSQLNPIAEMSVASRDEMVDRLLAMGFTEADCLTAISRYGTDVDRAISWLCERPVAESHAAVAGVDSASDSRKVDGKLVNSSGKSGASVAAHISAAVGASSTATPSSGSGAGLMSLSQAMAAGSADTFAATPQQQQQQQQPAQAAVPVVSQAAKLQKEKEELRRINRAWNQKAEDEKRKLEAQRREAEEQKQREAMLQKRQQEEQQQLQLQQQLLYQQRLQQQQQQFVLMQQQQQQMIQQQRQQQQYAMAGMNPNVPNRYQMPGMSGGGAAGSQPMVNLHTLANMNDSTLDATAAAAVAATVSAAAMTGGSSVQQIRELGGGLSLQAAMAMSYHNAQSLPSSNVVSTLGMNDPLVGAFQQSPLIDSSALGSLSMGGGSLQQLDSSHSAATAAAGSSSSVFGRLPLVAPNAAALGSAAVGVPQLTTPDWGSDLNFGFHSSGDNDEVVDGAVELSAIAKPFIPKFSSPSISGMAAPLTSTPPGIDLNSTLVGSATGSSPWSAATALDMSAGLPNITSLPPPLEPDGLSPNNAPRFLSSLLPADLNLDDYGDDTNDMPNLDSFLLDDLK